MRKLLDKAGWIAAFAVLCVAWGFQVMQAVKPKPPTARDQGTWICPILGQCGPPGTPGLGRW